MKNRKLALTQSGRTAVALLGEATGLKVGDEVLMSAYNCGSEVDALLAAGLSVRCVDCDEQGFVSAESMAAALGPNTRAVYIIHPFGWPQPLDEIDAWRKKSGLVLLEDCALALFSSYPDGTPVGTTGEASIFSFPKTLPSPGGGALTWNTGWKGPETLDPPPVTKTARQLASRGKAWFRRRFANAHISKCTDDSVSSEKQDFATEDLPAHYYFEEWRRNRRCSFVTRRLLSHVSPDQIRARRRSNYSELLDLLRDTNAQSLFPDLPAGVCPLCFPVRIENRDRVVAALDRCGIETSRWWSGGHRDIDWSRYPNASALKATIVPLPIHQQLDECDMKYISDVARKYTRIGIF